MRRRETEALKDLLLGTPDSWQLDLNKPLEDSDCGLIPPQSILENLSTLGKTEKKRTMSPRSLNRMCSRSDSLDFPSIPDLPPAAPASASSGATSGHMGSKASSEVPCSARFSDGGPQRVPKEKIVRFIDQPIEEEDEDDRLEQLNGTMLSSSSTIRPDGFANASYGAFSDGRSRPHHDRDRDCNWQLDDRENGGRGPRNDRGWNDQNRSQDDPNRDRHSYGADRNRNRDHYNRLEDSDRDGYGTHNNRDPDGDNQRQESDRDGYGARHEWGPDGYDQRQDRHHDAYDARHEKYPDGYEQHQDRQRDGCDRGRGSEDRYRCGDQKRPQDNIRLPPRDKDDIQPREMDRRQAHEVDRREGRERYGSSPTNKRGDERYQSRDNFSHDEQENVRLPSRGRDDVPPREMDRRQAHEVNSREERDRYVSSPTNKRGDERYRREDQQFSRGAQENDGFPPRNREDFPPREMDTRQVHEANREQGRERYVFSPTNKRGDERSRREDQQFSRGAQENDGLPPQNREDFTPREMDRRQGHEADRREGRERHGSPPTDKRANEWYGAAQAERDADGRYPYHGGRDSQNVEVAVDKYGAYGGVDKYRDSTNQYPDWDADRNRYPLPKSRDKFPVPNHNRDAERFSSEVDHDRRNDRHPNDHARDARSPQFDDVGHPPVTTRNNRDDDPGRDTLPPLSNNRDASPILRQCRLRRDTAYPTGAQLDEENAETDPDTHKHAAVQPINTREQRYPLGNSSERTGDHPCPPNMEISSYREVDGCHISSQSNYYNSLRNGDEPRTPPASALPHPITPTKENLRRGERSRTLAELRPHALREHAAEEITRGRSLSSHDLKINGAKSTVNYMEGWLLKRGPRHGMDWRLRFCRLEDHLFTYYQNEDWKTRKGEIDLKGYRVVRAFRHPQCSAEARALYKKHRWGFEIFKSDEDRIYLFDASTEEKLLVWLKVLGQVLHGHSADVVEADGSNHQANDAPRSDNSDLPPLPVSPTPQIPFVNSIALPVPVNSIVQIPFVNSIAQNELRPPATATGGAPLAVTGSAHHWNTSMALQLPDPRETLVSGGAPFHPRCHTAPHLRPPSVPHLPQPQTSPPHHFNAPPHPPHHAPSLSSSAFHGAPPSHTYAPQPQSHGVVAPGSDGVHQVKTVHVSYNPGTLHAHLVTPSSTYNVPQYDAPPGYGGPEVPGVGAPYGGPGHHDPASHGVYYPRPMAYSLPLTSNHAMSSPHMQFPSNWGSGGA